MMPPQKSAMAATREERCDLVVFIIVSCGCWVELVDRCIVMLDALANADYIGIHSSVKSLA